MFLSYLNLLSLGIVFYCIYVLQPLGCKQAINVIIIITPLLILMLYILTNTHSVHPYQYSLCRPLLVLPGHYFSFTQQMSSVLCTPLPPDLCLLPSDLCPVSLISPLTSDYCPLSSVLCHLTSALSSDLWPLPSDCCSVFCVLCLLTSDYCTLSSPFTLAPLLILSTSLYCHNFAVSSSYCTFIPTIQFRRLAAFLRLQNPPPLGQIRLS